MSRVTTALRRSAPSSASLPSLTPNATAWAWSSYVEVHAGVAADSTALALIVHTTGTGLAMPGEAEIQLAVGAAGAEVPISTIRFGQFNSTVPHGTLQFGAPIDAIPNGSRLAVRLRKSGTDTTAWAVGAEYAHGTGTTLGDAATTRPQQCLPSGAAGISVTTNTVGWASTAWFEVTSGLADAIAICGYTVGTVASQATEWDIGTGSAGAETVIATLTDRESSNSMFYRRLIRMLGPIPSSTRIAVRRRTQGGTSVDALFSLNYFVADAAPAPSRARITQFVVQTMAPNTQTCPTPEEGEDLCVTIDDPVLFGSWSPGDGNRYWFAETSLDDPDAYYGGWKEDRLLGVSEIRRSLSGTNYDYEIGNFSVELADDDYFIRSKLGVAPTNAFARREIEIYAISPEGRDDQSIAKRLALGYVDQDPQFDERSESMSVRFTCRDRIGAAIGWTVNGQQKLPRRVITQINLPGAGAAVLGKGAPIPYGTISSFIQPSGSPSVSIPIPSGLVAECAFFEGTPPNEFWQAGYGNRPATPSPVTGQAISVLASGALSIDVPSATYYAQIFPVSAAGVFGDPRPFCNDGLSAVVSSGNQQIQVSWTASAGAASYAVFLGTRFYDIDFIQWLGTAGTSVVFNRGPAFGTPATVENITPGAAVVGDPQFWYYKVRSRNGSFISDLNPIEIYGISSPQLPNGPQWRPIRVRWRTTGAPQYEVLRRGAGGDFDRMWVIPSSQFNNGLHYFDDDLLDTNVIYLGAGVSSQPVGAVPTFYAGREVLPNQQEWGRLLIAGCAIKGVDEWYYTQDTPNFVTEITQGDGVDFIFPKDDSAWFDYFPVRYRDLAGTDGVTRRWTFGYVRGAKLAMIEAGSGSVTINLRGVESDGGGTGSLLTDIHDQFRHFLRTQISVSGEGYLTGQWATTPRFSDEEICTIDDDAFEAMRDRRESELGSSLLGAGILGAGGTLTTVSEELKRWGTCMEARIGPNRFWQITTAAINENLTASGLASLTDEHDIHARTFRPMPRQSELFNVIPYRYAPNYVAGGWVVDGQQEVNDASVSRYGFRQESAPVEFHYLRDPTSVAFVVGMRSRRQADIPTYVSLEGSLCLTGASYDVGSYIRVDHWRGLLMSGWRNRPLWVLANTVNPSTRRVRLDCLDVTNLVPSGVSA